MALAQTDYIPTIDKVLQHWSDAETKLGRAITLADGTTRDGLQDLKTEYEAIQQAALTAGAHQKDGINQRDLSRKEGLEIAKQARKGILGLVPGSDPARELPTRIPAFNTDPQKQLLALRQIELAWQHVNALPASQHPALVLPLVLLVSLNGTDQSVPLARYSATIAALAAATTTLETAEQVLTQSQKDRKALSRKLDGIFTAYRKVIRGLFPAASPLTQSLP
jgi:hypothetical protein